MSIEPVKNESLVTELDVLANDWNRAKARVKHLLVYPGGSRAEFWDAVLEMDIAQAKIVCAVKHVGGAVKV